MSMTEVKGFSDNAWFSGWKAVADGVYMVCAEKNGAFSWFLDRNELLIFTGGDK